MKEFCFERLGKELNKCPGGKQGSVNTRSDFVKRFFFFLILGVMVNWNLYRENNEGKIII